MKTSVDLKNKTRREQIKNRTRVLTVDKLGSDLFKRLHDTIILKYIKLSICAVIFTGAWERERGEKGEKEKEGIISLIKNALAGKFS